MKKIGVTLFASIVFLLAGCEQKLAQNTAKLVKELEHYGTFSTSQYIGENGVKSKQWDVSEQLSQCASTKELTYLAWQHPSPVVRLCAFKAILMKEPDVAVSIAVAHLHDKSAVETISGCLVTTESTEDVRIWMIQDNRRQYHVSPSDSMKIDSLMLYTPHLEYMYYLSCLLDKLPPLPRYYNRIRSIYVDEDNTDALPALAKYRTNEAKRFIFRELQPRKAQVIKESEEEPETTVRKLGEYDWNGKDKRTIKDVYYWKDSPEYRRENAYKAIANWPDQAFIPVVKKMYISGILHDSTPAAELVFRALLGYKEQWARDLVEKAIGGKGKGSNDDGMEWNRYCFDEAYKENPSEYYLPLVKKYLK